MKEKTSSTLNVPFARLTNEVTKSVSRSASWLNRDNSLFSSMLEKSVSNLQVCLMGHASVAFTVLVSSASAMTALLSLAWTVWAVTLCKKGGLQ